MDSINSDCIRIINEFHDMSTLANMMQCSRQFNKSSMVAVGITYKRKVPTTGLMHTGRLFTQNKRQKLRGLLGGNAEAIMIQKCRLCSLKCSTISDFGFVAHARCVRKFECSLSSNSLCGLSSAIVPQFPTLKTRTAKWNPEWAKGCKVVVKHFCIRYEIKGIFPKKHSLSGFFSDKKMAEFRRIRNLHPEIN